ncbi:MAG TPA: hypothetical protein VKV95_16205 [Terriglobia bacterium]|nr:hypothetical protein [Terriglobia bacterium]
MKPPSHLSAFLPTVLLLIYSGFPARARSAVPAAPSGTARATQASEETPPASSATVIIPGPLRSFLRMAALSQKISPEEVLPLFAHSIEERGYSERTKPNEYLILVERYLKQAKELQALAGPEGVIQVSKCTESHALLNVLGYRLRQACGPDVSLETADPERAFLTIDSGFPLTELEECLRGDTPFVHPYPDSRLPVMFSTSDWIGKARSNTDLIDTLLHDSALARLYWAMSRIDENTATILQRSPGIEKLVPLAPALDFYGSHLYVRSGRIVVPGGPAAESAWKNLVGASPDSPGQFITSLLSKDQGWLAAYFDALSWASATQQAYFTQAHRLPRLYDALRGRGLSPSPTRPVFRPYPGLLLLTTRLQINPVGQPHIPGGLEVWKEIFRRKSDSKIVKEWGQRADAWKNPEQLMEGLFAVSRVDSESGPLKVFLAINEIDRGRSPEQRLTPQTVRLLGENFARFRSQYLIFSEFHPLNNASITRFLSVAESIDDISNKVLRADTLGILEANIGLWQILARQDQIPSAKWNESWQRVIGPFGDVKDASHLFDASRTSLGEIWRAAAGKTYLSQKEIVDLLSGPDQSSPEGTQVKQELANKMRSVLDAQRLVSLDDLFALANGLSHITPGEQSTDGLAALAGELREFEMPKPIFTPQERSEWAVGLYHDDHLQLEMGTDFKKLISGPGSPKELAEARGRLVPFLRDSLVGLNYAFYEPPGAQMIHNNALLVRCHNFSGEMEVGAWQTPNLSGRGSAAGGGAHLTGSLADLPYVLAKVEQQFIVPENVQSLIWDDLVPALVTGAVVPRWWRVSSDELHAVTLYQRFGEDLVKYAAQNENLRQRVMNILCVRMLPQSSARVESALRGGQPEEALSQLAPGETFFLAAEFRRSFPEEINKWGTAGQDLEKLSRRNLKEVNWERLSEDFGVPHPALAQTYSRELLNVQPLPLIGGYSSRLLAESWDSNNLYWARLADEMGYPPVMLNRLVPELTRRMIEKIFASHLDDRPALLRALRETGEEFRLGKMGTVAGSTAGSGH